MRILYVQTIRLDTELCRTSRLGLIQSLLDTGCTVTMVAMYVDAPPVLPGGATFIGIRALRIPYLMQLCFNMAAHGIVFWRVLSWRPDVVLLDPYTFHCAFPYDILACLGLSRTRVVMDIRSGIFHERHRGAFANTLRRLLRRVAFAYGRRLFSGYTTISPMLRETLVNEFGLPAERIGIWQSGVAPAINAAAPPAGGTLRVLYHGTFGINRGLCETIEAMRILAASRQDIDLLFLGSGTEEAALKRAAEGLPNVRFHDAVPHERVAGFLADCDIGILPFKPTPVMRSSSPLKLLEYVAARRPVIASRIEAVADVVGADGAVYLEDQTPAAIASAIAWAADHRAELRQLAARASATAEGRYTWRQQAESLREFLATLT